MNNILVVLSSADNLVLKNQQAVKSGYYLNELATPALAFIDAGYEIVVATPSGQKAVVDEHSKDISHFDNDRSQFEAALRFIETHPSVQSPITLAEAATKTDDFAAVFVPGGHVPITDLMQDENLGKILTRFHQQGKVTALLCHGPIALLAALPETKAYRRALVSGDKQAAEVNGKHWPYENYRMTIFSNAEEKFAEQRFNAELAFYVADALNGAGGHVENGPNFQPFVVQDKELITGQNPASDRLLAEKVLEALKRQQV